MRRLTGVYALLLVLLFALKLSFAYPGLVIELYYPDNYRFALAEWKPIEHVTVTGPDNFFAESDNTIIPLPSPPVIGNTYQFDIKFEDGSNELWNYTVTGFMNSFAHMISPADGEEVHSTEITFSWSEATGVDRYKLMIDDGTVDMWSVSLPAGTTTCIYNFDGTALGELQYEKTYGILLHAFDSNGHQATTTATFRITRPCTEVTPSRRYRMKFQYDCSLEKPEKLWLPIPRPWEGNGVVDLKIIRVTPTPTDRYYDPNGTGTEIGYWELSGNGTENIIVEFIVELSLIRHCIDDNRTWPTYDTNSILYQKNTASTPWVQSDHPEVVNLAQEIIGNETNPYQKAKLIFNWVSTEIGGLPIDQPPEPDGDALLVIQRGTAGCGGYSNLFVALCRAVGIPARSIGVWTPPTDERGLQYFGEGSHCIDCQNPGFGTHVIAEFYLQDYGWIQVDAAGGDESQFGNIPFERLFLSKGNEIDMGHDYSCPSEEGWNNLGGVSAWFHVPRIPSQAFDGITLKIDYIYNSSKKIMPWIPLLLDD
jgi:hypothetical protein